MSGERGATEITLLLERIGGGDGAAKEELAGKVYAELRRMAGGMMRQERAGHTLQPTALVHEAYIGLSGDLAGFQNRAHFYGAAAQAMRRLLVEHARKRAAQKRGGGAEKVTWEDVGFAAVEPNVDLLVLDQALDELGRVDPRLLRVVELRYFAGCGLEEIAKLSDLSLATVKRDWAYAIAWLYDYMNR